MFTRQPARGRPARRMVLPMLLILLTLAIGGCLVTTSFPAANVMTISFPNSINCTNKTLTNVKRVVCQFAGTGTFSGNITAQYNACTLNKNITARVPGVVFCSCSPNIGTGNCVTSPATPTARVDLGIPVPIQGVVIKTSDEPIPEAVAVDRFFEEVWNLGNLKAMDEILSPDFVSHDLATAQTFRGSSIIRQSVLYLQEAFTTYRFTYETPFLEGDRVTVRWKFVGTPRSEEAQASPLEVSGTTTFRIVDEKIVESWFDAGWNLENGAWEIGNGKEANR